jgi:hypothetical protein
LKEYIFLNSLPRSGNTLLGAIVNQNPQVSVTANSILNDVIYQLQLLKNDEIYQNFPDEQSFNNIIKNVFNNYYKDWKAKVIIDRGAWGTPLNLLLLKSIITKPKFIILYRPVLECLASFIRIEKPKDIELRCHELMNDNGMIGKNLWSIKNTISNKENYIRINYLDLVTNPVNEINKIYKFLNIDSFKHKFTNFNQFVANKTEYNDSVLKAELHKIKTDKVEIDEIKIKNYLPLNIINQYCNLDI